MLFLLLGTLKSYNKNINLNTVPALNQHMTEVLHAVDFLGHLAWSCGDKCCSHILHHVLVSHDNEIPKHVDEVLLKDAVSAHHS